ncbi:MULTISPECIES: hypothetical protein [Paenibacillus]|nr:MULTISPECIES: hypothetical protein [Paenibacillus]
MAAASVCIADALSKPDNSMPHSSKGMILKFAHAPWKIGVGLESIP